MTQPTTTPPLPSMPQISLQGDMTCYPDDWTGFTTAQQEEFRARVASLGLLRTHIHGIPIPQGMYLLWAVARRYRQRAWDYDENKDLVWQLSNRPTAEWQLIRDQLLRDGPARGPFRAFRPDELFHPAKLQQMILDAQHGVAGQPQMALVPPQQQSMMAARPHDMDRAPLQQAFSTGTQEAPVYQALWSAGTQPSGFIPPQQREEVDVRGAVAAALQAAEEQRLLYYPDSQPSSGTQDYVADTSSPPPRLDKGKRRADDKPGAHKRAAKIRKSEVKPSRLRNVTTMSPEIDVVEPQPSIAARTWLSMRKKSSMAKESSSSTCEQYEPPDDDQVVNEQHLAPPIEGTVFMMTHELMSDEEFERCINDWNDEELQTKNDQE